MYDIRDLNTNELIESGFDTYHDAAAWFEGNGMDYDHYGITGPGGEDARDPWGFSERAELIEEEEVGEEEY